MSKEKIGKFVNSKLKDLGFQTGKIQYKQRARQPVVVRRTGEAPRAIAPRVFRKTKEQEVEDLQRRREPESIELFQLTKDSLVDLAKKAGVISPSTLTKLQLIQAIQKTKITKEDVEKVVEEKKQKEEKLQEFVDNASQMAKKTLQELLELRDRYIEERKQDRSLPDLKLPQGRPTKEKVLQLILRYQDAKFRKLEEEREAQESYERKQEEQRRERVMRREEALETQRREALEGKEQKAEELNRNLLKTIEPELKKEVELKEKERQFKLQQGMKKLRQGLDTQKWKQVLKMASDAERKENKEYNEQFDKAVDLFQSDMDQIEQKEREEKKRIKDEKVRKATEFANKKAQERAFELFKKNVKELKEEKELESKADTFRTQKAKERLVQQVVLNKEIKGAEKALNKIPRGMAKGIVRAGEQQVEEGKLSKQNFLPVITGFAMATRKTIKEKKRKQEEEEAERELQEEEEKKKKLKEEKRKQRELKRKQEEEEAERELQEEEEKIRQGLITEIMTKESDFFSKQPQKKISVEDLGQENTGELRIRLKNLDRAIEKQKSKPPPRSASKPALIPVGETVIQGSSYPLFQSTTISGQQVPARPQLQEEEKQPPRLNTITKFSQAPPPTTVEPEIEQAEPIGGAELAEPDVPAETQNSIQASTPLPRSNPQEPTKRRGERGGVKKKKPQAQASVMEEPEISGTGHKHNADNLPEGKGIDNHTIDRFLSKFGNEYLGCIACDEIPSKIYPKIRPRTRGFFVMNTQPSYKGGLHWVCLLMDARPHGSSSIEYFDSFADPIPERLQQDIKGIAERLDAKTYLKLKENRIKFQSESSDNCGHFCMEFICDRMRGKPFPEASKFNDSVRGEDEVNRWKTMNGFGFLPSFGMIRSALQRPQVPSVVKNAWNKAGEKIEQFRQQFFPAKKLPAPVQVLFDKYKNNKVISAQIRREPIFAIIDKVINLISGGKFDEAKKEQGYDKMFHLSLIITLDNGTKLLIEKNERINMTTSWKDTDKVEYFSVGSINSTPTLEQFFQNTEKAVGDHRFFTYNAFDQNCQRFIADLLQSNNSLTNNAQNFILQDAQSIVKKMPFFVSKIAQFATDTAGRVKQFFGFGSSGVSKNLLKNNNNFTESSRHTRSIQRKQRFQNFMKKIKNVV